MTDHFRPAPGRLELVRQFVNTRDVEEGTDELSSPSALAGWLAERGLLPRSRRLDDADLRRATALREGLRRLLRANHGEPVDREAVKVLNRQISKAPLVARFADDGGLELEPAGSGLDAAVASLFEIVREAMLEGTWPRLKVCSADECEWAFYDRSRNRSGTWCEMAVCGNRAKVRTYRQRERGSAGPRR
jgi:predicted RNA-binding Zn ribbon-like protein